MTAHYQQFEIYIFYISNFNYAKVMHGSAVKHGKDFKLNLRVYQTWDFGIQIMIDKTCRFL